MEQTIPVNLVTWLLGSIITLLTGCWAIFKYFEHQINSSKRDTDEQLKRLYERLDANKEIYYKEFVLKAVLKEYNDVRQETVDQRFEGLIALFNEKLDGLRAEIKNLADNSRK